MSEPWGEVGDSASLLEALYGGRELGEDGWLDGLWRAFAPLVPGGRAVHTARSAWIPGRHGLRTLAIRGADAAANALVQDTSHEADTDFIDSVQAAPRRVLTFAETFGARLGSAPVGRRLAQVGATDALVIQAQLPPGTHQTLGLVAASPGAVTLSPHGREICDRVGAHLAAAVRLRYGGGDAVEAVFAPDGRVMHAEGDALRPEARETLGRSVVTIDRARTGKGRRDPAVLLEAWRAIIDQRWSLVDIVESDGRRFMLARVNPPARIDDRRLTPREREVAALVVQGVPQKAVAYELDLSTSTVAFHMRNIARKVGASSNTEMVRMLAARATTQAPAAPAVTSNEEPSAA